jgi:hypothetical protein
MSKDNEITDELNQTMTNALLQLQKLVNRDLTQKHNFLDIVKWFLLGVISTAVDLAEINSPGATPLIYADIEAAAKLGGLRAIRKMQLESGSVSYSVSNIAPDDMTTAMNYLGNELSTALFKGMHELPTPLRNMGLLLRGIEALLANLINQKFDNPHQILDSLCEHVHMALNDLESRVKHQKVQH